MVQGSMRWVAAVTAAVLISGSTQAMEFQFTDSIVDLRFDEYGAIGSNFVGETQLLGATELPASSTNVDMVFAGAVYLPQFNTVLGSSSLKGRPGQSNPALTSLIAPNTLRSEYTVPTGPNGNRLGVQVTTSLTTPGLMHQTYKFIYRNLIADSVGGDSGAIVEGLPLRITYMLDPDIGSSDIDDNGSVASGTARHWDVDFANPGSATSSGFNDPMIEMRALLNGSAPDELGTTGVGSGGMLLGLNTPIPLSTDDVDGPGDDDDGAYGARWAQIDLTPNSMAVLDVDIQFGGLIPPDEKPIPEPVTATLSVMALGALAWRTTRRRGHDTK